MGLASIFETFALTFNCFFPSKQTEKKQFEINKKIHKLGERYNISILPVLIGKELKDIYPITDQVHKWNIFIVGKQKNYILANCYDINIGVDKDELINKQADSLVSQELNEFFNPVWDKTLEGNDLQFFMMWCGKTYFVNTYQITNGAKEVIGATMFIRSIEIMPNFTSREERSSLEWDKYKV